MLFVLERCLPLRASDAAFGSDVHCVNDASPCGEVGKQHITLRRREQHPFERSKCFVKPTAETGRPPTGIALIYLFRFGAFSLYRFA